MRPFCRETGLATVRMSRFAVRYFSGDMILS